DVQSSQSFLFVHAEARGFLVKKSASRSESGLNVVELPAKAHLSCDGDEIVMSFRDRTLRISQK
ncbi:hypothetical protein, partial [Klebsiella pneumoniae]